MAKQALAGKEGQSKSKDLGLRARSKSPKFKGNGKKSRPHILTELEIELISQVVAIRQQHREQQEIAFTGILMLLAERDQLLHSIEVSNMETERENQNFMDAHNSWIEMRVERDAADKALQDYVLSFDSLRTELRSILQTGRDDVRGTRWFAKEQVEKMLELVR